VSRKPAGDAVLIMRLRADRLWIMRFRALYEGALLLGAILAIVGGATIAALHFADVMPRALVAMREGYVHLVVGFGSVAVFTSAAVLLHRFGGAVPARPLEAPPEANGPAPARPESAPGVSKLYHEMKTYVDLEMWELALEKANAIVTGFPGSREAVIVSRNLNELRWKAEPKYVSQGIPLSDEEQKVLREKGLAQMYQHVRTYMELEMWELARQKAIAIMKNFPDSPESAELVKVFETIEKKAGEATGAAGGGS
jgi:hypothetical protein